MRVFQSVSARSISTPYTASGSVRKCNDVFKQCPSHGCGHSFVVDALTHSRAHVCTPQGLKRTCDFCSQTGHDGGRKKCHVFTAAKQRVSTHPYLSQHLLVSGPDNDSRHVCAPSRLGMHAYVHTKRTFAYYILPVLSLTRTCTSAPSHDPSR